MMSRLYLLVLSLALLVVGTACQSAQQRALSRARATVGGDPARGAQLIQRYGCGGCHRISGIPGAAGRSAPSLEHLSSEPYISGNLPNSPENVIRWIRFPHSILPMTKMPDYALSAADARDITTYLWSLP
jgi:cytochrome c2